MSDPSNFEAQLKLAKAGDGDAMFNVYLHQTDPAASGYGRLSPQETSEWLLKAVDLCIPDAICTAGILFFTGERFNKDIAKGKELLRRAVELNAQNVDMMLNFAGLSRSDIETEAPPVDSRPNPISMSELVRKINDEADKLESEGFLNKGHRLHLDRVIKNLDQWGAVALLTNLTSPNEREDLRKNLHRLISIDGVTHEFQLASTAISGESDHVGDIFDRLKEGGVSDEDQNNFADKLSSYMDSVSDNSQRWYDEVREMRDLGEITQAEYEELFAFPTSGLGNSEMTMIIQGFMNVGAREYHKFNVASKKREERRAIVKFFIGFAVIAAIIYFSAQ